MRSWPSKDSRQAEKQPSLLTLSPKTEFPQTLIMRVSTPKLHSMVEKIQVMIFKNSEPQKKETSLQKDANQSQSKVLGVSRKQEKKSPNVAKFLALPKGR